MASSPSSPPSSKATACSSFAAWCPALGEYTLFSSPPESFPPFAPHLRASSSSYISSAVRKQSARGYSSWLTQACPRPLSKRRKSKAELRAAEMSAGQ